MGKFTVNVLDIGQRRFRAFVIVHQQIRIELISKAMKDLMFIVEEGRALTIACVAALFIGGTMPSVAQEIHPLSSDNPRVTKTDLVVDDALPRLAASLQSLLVLSAPAPPDHWLRWR